MMRACLLQLSLGSVHDAEIKKDKIGRKDDNEEQEEIELGGQDGKNNSEKQENESEENNTPTSVTLCEDPDSIYTATFRGKRLGLVIGDKIAIPRPLCGRNRLYWTIRKCWNFLW